MDLWQRVPFHQAEDSGIPSRDAEVGGEVTEVAVIQGGQDVDDDDGGVCAPHRSLPIAEAEHSHVSIWREGRKGGGVCGEAHFVAGIFQEGLWQSLMVEGGREILDDDGHS